MANSSIAANRTLFNSCFLMSILLIITFCAAAPAEEKKIREVTDPTTNINLTPFQQWRSAYYCMLNISDSCPDKYQLSGTGWVNVTQADTSEYCNSGCAQHTREVLMCVYLVKRDYKFADKSTVYDINQTISLGCNPDNAGFTGHVWMPSSAKRFSVSKAAFLSTAALLYITFST